MVSYEKGFDRSGIPAIMIKNKLTVLFLISHPFIFSYFTASAIATTTAEFLSHMKRMPSASWAPDMSLLS